MFELVFVIIVAGAIIGNLSIALIRRREIDFLRYEADPDRYGAATITSSITGTIVGGGMFLAVGQIGYEAGITGFVIGGVYAAGMFLMAALTPRIRSVMDRHDANTLIDLLDKTHNPRVGYLFALVCFFMFLFLTAGQFVAIYRVSTFLEDAFGLKVIPYALGAIAAIALFVYPAIGGLRKDIVTDILQTILVSIGALVLIYGLWGKMDSAGWMETSGTLLSGEGYGAGFLAGVIIFFTPLLLMRMDFWQRARAAKSTKEAQKGLVAAGLVSFLFFALFTFIGAWARATGVKDAGYATLHVIFRDASGVLSLSIIIAAFYAAVLSTADTFINNASLFLSRIARPSLWRSAQQSFEQNGALLFFTRFCAFASAAIGVVIAIAITDIVNLFVGSLSLLLIFAPAVIGALFDAFRDPDGAFWGPAIGLLVFLALFFVWNPKLAFVPAVILSLCVYAAVGLWRRFVSR